MHHAKRTPGHFAIGGPDCRSVLVKIALFLVMLGFGAANRYWFTPRLLPTNVPTEDNTRALRLLCASVSLEIALGLVVICVVAILGQLPPPGHEHHMDLANRGFVHPRSRSVS
jgi:hypothetical protein